MTPALEALSDPGQPGAPLLVLLHGVGSDEHDLLPLGKLMLPHATVVSLRAPFTTRDWGYGAGYAWYQFGPDLQPVAATLDAGADALARTIAAVPERFAGGGPLIVAGFSQGAAMALHHARHHAGGCAGVVMWSGYLIDVPGSAEGMGALPPVFWGHGTTDPVVPFTLAETGWSALRAARVRLQAHRYDGMPHTVWPAEVDDTRQWLAALTTG